MSIAAFLNFRWLLAAIVALAVAGTTYGFAASNTVSTSGAGDGNATISGYTIGSVTYDLNATNPSLIDTVHFTVTPTDAGNPQPTTVKAQLVTSGTWYAAAHGTGTAWSIDLSSANVSVASVNNLRVVAAQ